MQAMMTSMSATELQYHRESVRERQSGYLHEVAVTLFVQRRLEYWFRGALVWEVKACAPAAWRFRKERWRDFVSTRSLLDSCLCCQARSLCRSGHLLEGFGVCLSRVLPEK